jgi:hypothetical protein
MYFQAAIIAIVIAGGTPIIDCFNEAETKQKLT